MIADLLVLHAAQRAAAEIDRHELLGVRLSQAPLSLVSVNDVGGYVDLELIWSGPAGLVTGLWVADHDPLALDVLVWLEAGQPVQIELVKLREGWTWAVRELIAKDLQFNPH